MVINLLPGATLPHCHKYTLSLEESKSKEAYIAEALGTSFIHVLSSPTFSGFFFVKKKDGTLRPRIYYRGLKSITVKDSYPLLLI